MRKARVVIDTSVVVAALRSRRGAAFELFSLLSQGRFEVTVSVPLVFEYEDALARFIDEGLYEQQDVEDFLDFICRVADRQRVFFLWRPVLPDAKDDMVLEAAIAGGCGAIVTHNRRDFVGAEHFAILVLSPKEFLDIVREDP